MRLSLPLCRAALNLVLLSALCQAMPTDDEDSSLVVTRSSLHSELLGEDRPLLISLPESYAASPTAGVALRRDQRRAQRRVQRLRRAREGLYAAL